MKLKRLHQSDQIAIRDALRSFNVSSPLDDQEFDALAKYCAVAGEMESEPFFSDDNHDSIGTREAKRIAKFGHPAFLKSALLPFRKLWMRDEDCYFERVRNIIRRRYGDMRLSYIWTLKDIVKQRYIEGHKSAMNEAVKVELETEKVKKIEDLINIWLYTHGFHTGTSTGKYSPKDFDEIDRKAGRQEFEFCFRRNVKRIGMNSYLSFYWTTALPIFEQLRSEGRCPSFEVEAAFRYNPYRYLGSEVQLNDACWHLDKENEEETFDRLLKREDFSQLKCFFAGYFFPSERAALDALKQFPTFDELLKETGCVSLPDNDDSLSVTSHFFAEGNLNNNGGEVIVYEEKCVLFRSVSQCSLSQCYERFKEAFFNHRKSIPRYYSGVYHPDIDGLKNIWRGF